MHRWPMETYEITLRLCKICCSLALTVQFSSRQIGLSRTGETDLVDLLAARGKLLLMLRLLANCCTV